MLWGCRARFRSCRNDTYSIDKKQYTMHRIFRYDSVSCRIQPITSSSHRLRQAMQLRGIGSGCGACPPHPAERGYRPLARQRHPRCLEACRRGLQPSARDRSRMADLRSRSRPDGGPWWGSSCAPAVDADEPIPPTHGFLRRRPRTSVSCPKMFPSWVPPTCGSMDGAFTLNDRRADRFRASAARTNEPKRHLLHLCGRHVRWSRSMSPAISSMWIRTGRRPAWSRCGCPAGARRPRMARKGAS